MEGSEDQSSGTERRTHNLALIYAFASVIFCAGILFLSLGFLYSPSWTPYYNLAGPVYFFVLLPMVFLGFFPFILIMSVMMALYISFFYFMLVGSSDRTGRLIDTPAGYFAIVGPALIVITIVISLIEQSFGVGIGGSSVENQLLASPYLAYNSLIYAPFAEEIGFRIIPLGLFSFATVYAKSRNVRDSLYSIVAPGRMRSKYGLKIGWIGIILIFATSILWGYAHVYYGAWDAGKILTVAITGIALAMGYLKFGVYVDIPIHWLNNGALTLALIFPLSIAVITVFTVWLLIAGMAGIVMLVIYFALYLSGRGSVKHSAAE